MGQDMSSVQMCCGKQDTYEATPIRDMSAKRKVKPTTLDDMSDLQQQYYKKCVNLVFQMSMTLKSQNKNKIIEHTDHQNTWNYVRQIGETMQDPFFDFAQKLVDSLPQFQEQNKDVYVSSNGWDLTAMIRSELMPDDVAKDRVDNDGNWLRVINVCRASIVFNSFKDLYAILLMLAKYNQNCCGFEMVQIKNQGQIVPALKNKGWSNILVSMRPVQFDAKKSEERRMNLNCTEDEKDVLKELKLDKTINEDAEHDDEKEEDSFLNLPGHVCELQLIHRASWSDYQDAYNSFL